MTIDLDAYFARIGYAGPRTATLDTLRALHQLHPQAIAFENLDPWLGRPVSPSAEALARKLVHGRRGGYCYEHNALFGDALRALGFTVHGLAARVAWRVPDASVMPRGHMLLRVDLPDGPYLADVGFGGLTLTAPLRLVAGEPQPTPHEPFRLDPDGDGWQLTALVAGQWQPLYRFDLALQLPADYEVFNWYVSTHPASRFVRHLIAARPLPDRRLALLDRELTVYHRDGRIDRRTLDAPALRNALEDAFALDVSELTDLDGALERLSISSRG